MSDKLLISVYVSLFAAFICCGSFLSVPLTLPGGVPISIQNMLAILAGSALGSFYGFFSVLIFIFLGIIGVPVFTGMQSGITILQGPTGGYLIGYAVASLFVGLILGRPKYKEINCKYKYYILYFTILLIGYALIYFIGVLRFKHITFDKSQNINIKVLLSITVLPYLPFDILKLLLSVPLTKILRKNLYRYIQNEI